jgi:hypothetical protein
MYTNQYSQYFKNGTANRIISGSKVTDCEEKLDVSIAKRASKL